MPMELVVGPHHDTGDISGATISMAFFYVIFFKQLN